MATQSQTRELMERALAHATADHVTVSVDESEELATRIANSAITQNVERRDRSITVSAAFGNKVGHASDNDLSDGGVRAVVHRAEEVARSVSPDPEYVPPPEPAGAYPHVDGCAEATRAFTPDEAASAIVDAVREADKAGVTIAGRYRTSWSSDAILNNRGLYHAEESTWAQYTNTAMTDDSSGWATSAARSVADVDVGATVRSAIHKAKTGTAPRDVDPGAYTVILEPNATYDLLSTFYGVLDAKAAHEGRSCLSGKEGATVAGENITIASVPTHPDVGLSATMEAGLPAPEVKWIDGGTLANLRYSRYWAGEKGHAVTQPVNFVMDGGTGSAADLVASTERGILVTRFWYIRFVDPMTFLLTGMTRDGLFWIEDGEVRHGITNLRFNESPLRVLGNVEAMSAPARVGSPATVPALKVRDFRFTSGTSF
ncbi:TldD/PmbA family protein [Candidatus Poribacteria bacterium]|jgi:predicted Zn-dependent protease|nr:TldD/PmbA family protein [Candidatus Poribacteria bacterium]MBT5712644.1 TldD/PmbA family protein [Candidatus Poribacteria bacterium]MBT7100041.1 TldD/PmbA family protein [Candidatus Poribacteria bacterium]MBT7807032.1 TldD/PmbA family protein [Candidatus Poribacteria bacterium]